MGDKYWVGKHYVDGAGSGNFTLDDSLSWNDFHQANSPIVNNIDILFSSKVLISNGGYISTLDPNIEFNGHINAHTSNDGWNGGTSAYSQMIGTAEYNNMNANGGTVTFSGHIYVGREKGTDGSLTKSANLGVSAAYNSVYTISFNVAISNLGAFLTKLNNYDGRFSESLTYDQKKEILNTPDSVEVPIPVKWNSGGGVLETAFTITVT